MKPEEQAVLMFNRYYCHITGLLSKNQKIEQHNAIVQTAKESVIFAATLAQKTTDIRGFNFWMDVIEFIESYEI